jgi:NADH-quinone oxidoreductase subunit N
VSAFGAVAPTIPAPHIEYGQLSPMLLVFGAAVAGVFVEAFAPRSLRRALHLPITLGSLAGAFALTIVVAISSNAGHIDAGTRLHQRPADRGILA